MLSNIKRIVKQKDIIIFIITVLVSLLSFATGYIVSKNQNSEPIQFEKFNL